MVQRQFKIGSSNFSDLVARDAKNNFKYYFVDKTFFIQQFLQNQNEVLLIPRPRRFGKSTNLDMLKYFFSIDNAKDNRQLFTGLQIENAKLLNGEDCMAYQGRYPVIHLSFKDLKQDNFSSLLAMLKTVISKLYKQFPYLLQSEKLLPEEKLRVQQFIAETATDDVYQKALLLLISYLYTHHNQKVMVLIDEYDVPFQNAIHLRDYGKSSKAGEQLVEDLRKFFGVFLGGALKDNKELEKCLMTGVVRIAGAGVFSDLNNKRVYTILNTPFDDGFGFTEMELTDLLQQAGKIDELGSFRAWYNGYQFGGKIIYNPWSVMCCLESGEFISHWLETSNNNLIYSMLLHPKTTQDSKEINSVLAGLISGQNVQKIIDTSLVFDSRVQETEHLWIVLLSAGYLSGTQHVANRAGKTQIKLKIPNNEVQAIYEQVFVDWLKNKHAITADSPLIEYLLKGEAEQFCKELKNIFQKVLSSRDAPQTKDEDESSRYEAFYHGFMVGLLALSLEKNHHKVLLKSNRESGSGYYDLVLEPKDSDDKIYNKGVIFEFKRAQDSKNLRIEAQSALKQIKDKKYPSEMEERGIREVVCIGMAFYQGNLQEKYELYNCQQKTYLPITAVAASSKLLTSTYSHPPKATAPIAKKRSLSESLQQQSEDVRSKSPDTLEMLPRKKAKKTGDEEIKPSDAAYTNSDDDFEPPLKKKGKKKSGF